MPRFILRRLAYGLLICILIAFFFQLGMDMTANSRQAVPNFDLVELGFNAWNDTTAFFSSALRGDLGSIYTSAGLVEVKDLVWEAYANSMGLMLAALLCASILGLAIGIAAALIRRGWIVLPLLTITLLGISAPSFLGALLLQIGEIYYLRTFGRRLVLMAGFGWDFQHMLMPVLLLGARPLAYLTRASYAALSRIMNEDFIRTAYAKGLTTSQTVGVHALRNMVVPMLTAVGVSLRFSLSSLPVIEVFFLWPGMGLALLRAINGRQTALVVPLALMIGATLVVTNLLLDVIFRFVDPRTREGQWIS